MAAAAAGRRRRGIGLVGDAAGEVAHAPDCTLREGLHPAND
jgi:hypothetical protein